jgi:uncharacterized protein (TIGR01619 family)
MREVFTRVEDKTPINIEIEFDIGDSKKSNPWLFSVFVKYNSLDESLDGYEEFLETKESLIIAVEYEGNALYVGSMVKDGWSEFYFYSNTSKELNSLIPSILKNSGYTYESNIVKDKKWNFYETQLFPTELEQHNIQTAKVIFLLEEEGDNLSAIREVEHYVSFLTPTQKNRFINTLDIEGFSFKDEISSEEFEHGIALVKEHAVTYEEVSSEVAKLFEAIKAENGFYEGWSTTLTNENEEESDQ